MGEWNDGRMKKGYRGRCWERWEIKEEDEVEEEGGLEVEKGVVGEGFGKIRVDGRVNKEEVVVVEIGECREMEI